MRDFSASDAIGAGFRVVGRNPLALLAWAGLYLVLAILPQALIWRRMWPAMTSTVEHRAATSGQEMAAQDMMAAWAGIGAWAPLLWLCGFILACVMFGAVYRAVLEPQDRRFFYLRLGGRELWLGLTMFALLILFAMVCVIAGIALALIGHRSQGLVAFVAFLGALVGLIWLAMRFSLATSMAFAERRFIFLESWSLTEGHALKLFGVALALVGIILLGEMVLFIPVAVLASAFGVFGGHEDGFRGLGDPARWLPHAAPLIIVAVALLSLFAALSYAILGAPWADIYRQLTAEPAD